MSGPKTEYSNYRDRLKTGDVVLFSGKGLISRGIKRATRSKWSHIGMVIRLPEYDMNLLWESTTLSKVPDIYTGHTTSGVQIVSLSERVKTFKGDIAIRPIDGEITPEQIERLMAFRGEMRNKKYEKSRIELALSALKIWTFKNDKLDSVFCSELVAEAYQRAGWMDDKKASRNYTPESFSQKTNYPVPMKRGYRLGREIEIIRN